VLACARTKPAITKSVENGGAPSLTSFTQCLFPLFLAKLSPNFDLKNMVSSFDLYKGIKFEGSIQKFLIFLNIPPKNVNFPSQIFFWEKSNFGKFQHFSKQYNLCQSHQGVMVLEKTISSLDY